MIDTSLDIYLFLGSTRMFLDGFGYERALTFGHFSFTENWKQLELGSDIPLVFHGGAQTTNNSNGHRVHKHIGAQHLLPLPLACDEDHFHKIINPLSKKPYQNPESTWVNKKS